jgi:hypothetical protein
MRIQMSNYIKAANLYIHSGILEGMIQFDAGLNLISGENGTLKTKVLQQLKTQQAQLVLSQAGGACRIQAFSPKRNAQRRTYETTFNEFRQQNRKLESHITEGNINDYTFENYASLGDLYYLVHERFCRDGGNQRDMMDKTTEEFNTVIQRIFPRYRLASTWNLNSGSPNIRLIKNGQNDVTLEGLSLGEQEILSLVLNIYTARDRFEVYLIDEPEVHLNWHLEEQLFAFFDSFCKEYSRQIIIVTHSRVVFLPKYLPKAQFLYWNRDGKVEISQTLSDEQRRRIAGEAISILQYGKSTEDTLIPTFFVEDASHRDILEALSYLMKVEITVSECGNSSNVKSLFKLSKKEGGWGNSYFLIDGDNQGNPFPTDDRFIHLDKYCLQSYLLNFEVASASSGKSVEEIQQIIFNVIKRNRSKILDKNKFFDFLFDSLKPTDITEERLSSLDASEIFVSYLTDLGMDSKEYLSNYLVTCQTKGMLRQVFPEKLIGAFESNS